MDQLNVSETIGSLKYEDDDDHEKPHLKSEFAFFQSLSWLLQFIYYV